MTLFVYISGTATWLMAAAIMTIMLLCTLTLKNSKGLRGGGAMWASVVAMAVLFAIYAQGTGFRKEQLIAHLTAIQEPEEEVYYEVQFLGRRPVKFNPSDKRNYVILEDGRMISYNRIVNEQMCRTCKQFTESGYVDSLYVYRVQREEPHWYGSSDIELFFSKEEDIFLGNSQSVLVTDP